jgi:hypothetical protein
MATKKKTAAKKRKAPVGQTDPTGQALLHVNERDDAKPVTIKYVMPPELQVQYADNMNVTHTDTEFVLSFIQMQHPLIVSNEDWGDVDTIIGKCVARLIIHPNKMPLFIRALQENFNRFIQDAKAKVEQFQAEQAARGE